MNPAFDSPETLEWLRLASHWIIEEKEIAGSSGTYRRARPLFGRNSRHRDDVVASYRALLILTSRIKGCQPLHHYYEKPIATIAWSLKTKEKPENLPLLLRKSGDLSCESKSDSR